MMRMRRRIRTGWVTDEFRHFYPVNMYQIGFYCIMCRQPLTFR